MVQWPRLGQDEARNQDLHPGLQGGFKVPFLDHPSLSSQAHLTGAGKEVEELGLEPASIGVAGLAGGGFMCYATMPAVGT